MTSQNITLLSYSSHDMCLHNISLKPRSPVHTLHYSFCCTHLQTSRSLFLEDSDSWFIVMVLHDFNTMLLRKYNKKKKTFLNVGNLFTKVAERNNMFYYWISIKPECAVHHRPSAKRLQDRKIRHSFNSQTGTTHYIRVCKINNN